MLRGATAFLGVLSLLCCPAMAAKRVALVIGNSAYQHTPKLTNPKNDATDMAAALEQHGFQVLKGYDLSKAAFDSKVREFSGALKGAEAGLFFYAGHGLQVAGQNYLVPVDAKAESEDALDWEMLRVDLVHRTMERSTSTNILFLDACRDNPLARNLALAMGTRSSFVGRGLATIESGVGTLISFSTQPGNVALDGTGRNSPFAGALVKHMSASTDDLSAILIATRNDVMNATRRKQVPWEHSALTGRFYFTPPQAALPGRAPALPQISEAERTWAIVQGTKSVAVLEDFVSRYKDTIFAKLAQERIEELNRPLGTKLDTSLDTLPPMKRVETQVAIVPVAPAAPKCDGIEVPVGKGTRCLKPKDSFKDCDTCPEMVVVPAGSFTMGSAPGEEGRHDREGPQRKVTIERPFAVGKFEVTFAEWEACVAAGGCKHNPNDQGWGRGKRPAIYVSWDDAKEYVAWLSRTTGKTYRLLTEAEWEYAARAGTTTPFSTGRTITADQANFDGTSTDGGSAKGVNRGKTVEVGSFKANAFGLHDMHGNVWEWVEDCRHDSYQGAPTDGSAWTTSCTEDSWRVYRGGSLDNGPRSLRSAVRGVTTTGIRDYVLGFRVGRTLTP